MRTLCALALAMMFGLAACSQTSAPTLTPKYLVGYWVPDGIHCESDGGVAYQADGKFDLYEEAGTWRLVGDRLTYLTLSRGGTDEPLVQLKTPERYEARLSVTSADVMTATGPDGGAVRMTRCPVADRRP